LTKSDREHFRIYTAQNEIKHLILGKYLSAYVRALGRAAPAFHYIDGFAGCGLYADRHHGSPLIALSLLADQSRPFSVSFVEADPELFQRLSEEIATRDALPNLYDPPLLRHGQFHQFVDEILSRPIYTRFRNPATFAFIDPCGVQGVRMEDISRILAKPYGECLLFWNYDGINRWLGGVLKGEHDRAGLEALFGGDEFVDEALTYASVSTKPGLKEQNILELFMRALRSRGPRFVLPFRVQARDSDRTSHYLIHCSSNSLPFTIMKDVMGGAHTGEDSGAYEFSSAAETGLLFHPIEDGARTRILEHLGHGACKVETFTKRWICEPDDYFRGSDYKRILLELEAEGRIEVLDKQGEKPMPRTKRRIGVGGKPTLGDDYFVRAAGAGR
jgi:three-Cys-motif partner protein